MTPTPLTPDHSDHWLSAAHARLIASSAISEAVRSERGYFTATRTIDLVGLGWNRSRVLADLLPALVIPVRGLLDAGRPTYAVLRPDAPRITGEGKPRKYETPRGAQNVVDVPPRVREVLDDPQVPLWVTEGSRKADSLASAGEYAVAISGVFGWRGRNAWGGLVALPDWEAVALNGRDVRLGFDSDIAAKPNVANAAMRLGAFLAKRGASVRYLVLESD